MRLSSLLFATRVGGQVFAQRWTALFQAQPTFYTGVEIALVVGAVAAVAAAGVSAASAYGQAQTAKHNAKVESRNQETMAAHARKVAEQARQAQRRKDEAMLNSFLAKAAGQGVEAGTGSSLLAEAKFARDAEQAAQEAGYNAELTAHQRTYGASVSRAQAANINPTTSAAVAGGSSLASSGSSLATGLA